MCSLPAVPLPILTHERELEVYYCDLICLYQNVSEETTRWYLLDQFIDTYYSARPSNRSQYQRTEDQIRANLEDGCHERLRLRCNWFSWLLVAKN